MYYLIRDSNLLLLNQEVVDELLGMVQVTYDEVVVHLLTDDGEYARSCKSYNGYYDYKCQIDGCQLFILRPSNEIYHHVLESAHRIADPSSCEIVIVALLQIKAAHDVAVDLLELIEKYSGVDKKQARIMQIFYWLGISPQALSRNLAWPGRNGHIIYEKWFDSNKGLARGDTDSVTGHPLTPRADPEKAKEIAVLIVQKMLDLIEANSANKTARSVISMLPLPNKDYLASCRERIMRVYETAQNSTDDYIRHRAAQNYRRFDDKG